MTRTALLRPYVEAELAKAKLAREQRNSKLAWLHLERAHILSQPSARLHTRVHVAMLIMAVRHHDLRELAGQLVRLAVAGLGSLLGRYPVGNTGRARVPIAQPMPIEADLAGVLRLVEAAHAMP